MADFINALLVQWKQIFAAKILWKVFTRVLNGPENCNPTRPEPEPAGPVGFVGPAWPVENSSLYWRVEATCILMDFSVRFLHIFHVVAFLPISPSQSHLVLGCSHASHWRLWVLSAISTFFCVTRLRKLLLVCWCRSSLPASWLMLHCYCWFVIF